MSDNDQEQERFERQLGTALQRLRGRNAALRRRVAELEAERDRARAKLDEVYASETWRAGELLLRVPKAVREALRG